MDKKALAGIGIIAVGGIAVIMMSRSDSGPMPGAGSGGGGAPPPETKKESQGNEAPVFNINFPEPNFPSMPNPMDYYNQFTSGGYQGSTKKEQTVINIPGRNPIVKLEPGVWKERGKPGKLLEY